MSSDPDRTRRRAFHTVAIALGSDPDLALARARQMEQEDAELETADAYLLVLSELCEGKV